MPCLLCSKKDHGVEEDSDYLCGSCIASLSTLTAEGARHLIDQLYLKDQVNVAEWIEKIMTGSRSTGKTLKLKVRIQPYKNLKVRRPGLII